MENTAYFILLALLSEILGTIGGFGSSLFFVPLASYFLDFHTVLGLTALFHVLSNFTKIAFFRNGFDKILLVRIGIPSVLFVIVGALLSRFFETKTLEIILAFFLIIVSLTFLIFRNIVIKPNLLNTIGGGVFSGLIAGLVGTGGAIRGIVLAAYSLRIEVFIATSAIIDLGIDVSRSIVYYFNGFINYEILYLLPLLLLASICGTYLGKKILSTISEEYFKIIVLFLILSTGIITLIKLISK